MSWQIIFLQYSKIIICGRGISYLIGESISSSLAGVQIPTIKVNTELNENVYSVLPMIDKKTLILAISFPDYYFMTQKIAEYAKKNKAKIILITDSKETDIALYADEFILVGSTTRLALNTLSAPMALWGQAVVARLVVPALVSLLLPAQVHVAPHTRRETSPAR